MIGGDVMKVCALGILAAIVGTVLRIMKNELSFAVKVSGCVIIFGAALIYMDGLLVSLEERAALGGVSEYVGIMMRCLGVAVICEISSAICRECGENGLSGGVELIGKLEILVIALPLISDILDTVEKLISLGA